MRQDQLVARPGHADVEQPPLLLELEVALRQRLLDELERQAEGLAPVVRREPAGDEAGHEYDRELEALRLVDGEHRDGVGVRIEIRGRRIVAGLDQRLEVASDERRPIVGQQRRLGPDDVEEPGDVAERLLCRDGVAARRAGRGCPSRAGTDRAPRRRVVVGQLRERRRSATRRLAAARVSADEPEDAGLSLELVEDLPERSGAGGGRC